MGAGIKSLLGNSPYCFQIHGHIYHSVSLLYPNKANDPEYGQLENQSHQGRMAEVKEQLEEMM
jgi:hypothetical protein